MNWFKENKFLAGLLVMTLLGAGTLGYLLFTAKARYDETANTFQQQSAELNRLESLPAYPDKQNLEILEAQRVAHLGLIADLQKSLLASEVPLEQMSPNAFQDQLRQAVTQYTAKAGTTLLLPKGFYLGFEQYQTALPPPEAAPLLGRELKIIQKIGDILLARKGGVVSLNALIREPLPEESTKPKPEAAKPKPKPGEKPGLPTEPLVKSHAVEFTFIADQGAAREILNALANNKDQFLITRYVTIHNQVQTGPLRDAAPAPDAPAPPGGPVPGGEKTADPIIVGKEKVEVSLRVEIVDFAQPVALENSAPRANRPAAK